MDKQAFLDYNTVYFIGKNVKLTEVTIPNMLK